MQTRWAEWPIAQAVSWSGSGFIVYLSPDNFLQTTIFSAHASGGSAYLNGGDVRAYDAATGDPIPFELQFNKTTQTARLWARFPSFDGLQVLRLEWGDAGLSPLPVDDAYGRNAVWQDYALVIHATEDGTSATDSTGNGAVTVEGGGFAAATVAHPGGLAGWKFDGIDDRWSTPARNGIRAQRPFTAQAWTARGSTSVRDYLFNNLNNQGWAFWRSVGATSNLRYDTWNASGAGSGETVTWGTSWHSHAVTASSTTLKFYDNGAQIGADVVHWAQPNNTYNQPLVSGYWTNGSALHWSSASFTEWRIRPDILSEDWLATEYSNQSDPLSFWGSPDTGSITPDTSQPDDIALTPSVSAPTSSATVSASVQSIALGVAVSAPVASATFSASPADVWSGVFVSTPTATAGAAVTPDSIAAGVRVSSPSAHAVASASPDDVYMGAFVSAPTASESGEVLPADISMGLGVSSPIVTASASVVPGSVRLDVAVSAPSAGTATSAQPGSVRVPVAVSSPWVSTGALSTPDDVGLSVFVSSPVVDTSGVASPSHVIARVNASAPHVSAIWHAQPVNVRASVAVNSPATSTSVTVPDASRLHRACARPLVYRAAPRQRIHTIRRP